MSQVSLRCEECGKRLTILAATPLGSTGLADLEYLCAKDLLCAYSDANEVDEVDFKSESQVAGQILIIIRLTTTAAVESKNKSLNLNLPQTGI